jgi:hypothetical protein
VNLTFIFPTAFTVTPDVYLNPIVLVTPTKIRTIENKGSIKIDCNVLYQAASSSIRWIFNGNPIDANLVLNTKTILIQNALRQHSGEYTCLVTDIGGKDYFNSSIVQVEYAAALIGSDTESNNFKSYMS